MNLYVNEAAELYRLQLELIDQKVENAVERGFNRIEARLNEVQQNMQSSLYELKGEIKSETGRLREEMHALFADEVHPLKMDVAAIKFKLGMREETRAQLRTRLWDYAFKAGWIVLGALMTFGVSHLH